jgi:predicted CoA-binding protein
MKSTETILVLGASDNPARMSCLATRFLHNKGYTLFAVAQQKGQLGSVQIHDDSELNLASEVDVVTVFLKPERQRKYYDYILSLKPKQIIFNPGAENPELVTLATKQNIKTLMGCTIAMISNGLL